MCKKGYKKNIIISLVVSIILTFIIAWPIKDDISKKFRNLFQISEKVTIKEDRCVKSFGFSAVGYGCVKTEKQNVTYNLQEIISISFLVLFVVISYFITFILLKLFI